MLRVGKISHFPLAFLFLFSMLASQIDSTEVMGGLQQGPQATTALRRGELPLQSEAVAKAGRVNPPEYILSFFSQSLALALSTVTGSVRQSVGKLKPNLSGQRFRKCKELDNTGKIRERESNLKKWFMKSWAHPCALCALI